MQCIKLQFNSVLNSLKIEKAFFNTRICKYNKSTLKIALKYNKNTTKVD